MYIYYDTTDKNRIKAVYSGKPATKVWSGLGYTLAEIPKELNPSQDHLFVDGKLIYDPLPIIEQAINRHPLKDKMFKDLKVVEKNSLLLELLIASGIVGEDGRIK